MFRKGGEVTCIRQKPILHSRKNSNHVRNLFRQAIDLLAKMLRKNRKATEETKKKKKLIGTSRTLTEAI